MNDIVKKEYVCFSITGEFVTKTARSWLYEEKRPYTTVLNFLLSCMAGTSCKQKTLVKYANDVLTGKKKFIGNTRDDTYCLVNDNTDVLTVYSLYFKNEPKPKVKIEDDEEFEDDENENPTSKMVSDIKALDKRIKKIITKNDYGWLSPEGKFTPVEWGSHDAWAREYIEKHFKNVDVWKPFFYAGDYLTKQGWLLLHNPHLGAVELSFDEINSASKKQKEFLYDYFTAREMTVEARQVWKD